jgi:hypothetical protein
MASVGDLERHGWPQVHPKLEATAPLSNFNPLHRSGSTNVTRRAVRVYWPNRPAGTPCPSASKLLETHRLDQCCEKA